jgi:hypothetical protein
MKKDFIVSKIEAFQDGSQYVLIGFTDPNEPKSSGGAESPFDKSDEAIPFTSPEDLMKNLPKVFGAGGGIHGKSPTFKITMKEYEDMAIKIGNKVTIEINKVDGNGT